eukprot:gene14878-17590_t
MGEVVRTITIAPPCSEGYVLCNDGACSSVPCDTRDTLLAASRTQVDAAPPNITLLGDERVRLLYGTQNGSVMPCANFTARAGCYAVAWDDVDGDLTASLTVTASVDSSGSTTTASSSSTSEILCEPADVSLGICFPGLYFYTYTVLDQAGNIAAVELALEIVERAEVTAGVQLRSGAATLSAAEEEAANLRNQNSIEAAAVQSAVAEMLNSDATAAGLPTTEEDVQITSAEVDSSTSPFVIQVGLTVSTWQAGSDAASAARRHLLSASDVLPPPPTSEEDAANGAPVGSIEGRAESIIASLTASTTAGSGDAPAVLDHYLATAVAEKGGVTSLTSAGLSDATSRRTTDAVAADAAFAAALRSELTSYATSLTATIGAAEVVTEEVAAGAKLADGEAVTAQVNDVWAVGLGDENSNVQSLSEHLAEAITAADSILNAGEHLATDLAMSTNKAAEAAQEAADAIEQSVLPSTNASSAAFDEYSSYDPPPSPNGECNETNVGDLEVHFNISDDGNAVMHHAAARRALLAKGKGSAAATKETSGNLEAGAVGDSADERAMDIMGMALEHYLSNGKVAFQGIRRVARTNQ